MPTNNTISCEIIEGYLTYCLDELLPRNLLTLCNASICKYSKETYNIRDTIEILYNTIDCMYIKEVIEC